MDFRKAYEKRRAASGFGSQQLWLKTGERWNTSILKYSEWSSELKNGTLFQKWTPEKRFLIAKNMVSELLVTFYDVNTKAILAMRISKALGEREVDDVKKRLSSLRRPNLELRLIGLQNNSKDMIGSVERLQEAVDCRLVEVDLFGNQTRHIIIDLLTGKPYNLLLENRIYRPGELIVGFAAAVPPAQKEVTEQAA